MKFFLLKLWFQIMGTARVLGGRKWEYVQSTDHVFYWAVSYIQDERGE